MEISFSFLFHLVPLLSVEGSSRLQNKANEKEQILLPVLSFFFFLTKNERVRICFYHSCQQKKDESFVLPFGALR